MGKADAIKYSTEINYKSDNDKPINSVEIVRQWNTQSAPGARTIIDKIYRNQGQPGIPYLARPIMEKLLKWSDDVYPATSVTFTITFTQVLGTPSPKPLAICEEKLTDLHVKQEKESETNQSSDPELSDVNESEEDETEEIEIDSDSSDDDNKEDSDEKD